MTRAKEILNEIQSKRHAGKSAEQLATEALKRVQTMCRTAHDNGYSIGYAKGFEAGLRAAMCPTIEPSERLV
jgi:flagellar biosynthesis/type III secretory pathway protein FliH